VAVKAPVLVIVPTIAFPFAMSFTVHVTVGFVTFSTVAVNVCVAFARTDGLDGEIATRFSVGVPPGSPAQLEVTPARTTINDVSSQRRTAASRNGR
jgi:hypothetical protein